MTFAALKLAIRDVSASFPLLRNRTSTPLCLPLTGTQESRAPPTQLARGVRTVAFFVKTLNN
jgi:hypothetical protein